MSYVITEVHDISPAWHHGFRPRVLDTTSPLALSWMATMLGGGYIYIVDDDRAVRASLLALFEANGYASRIFSSAQEFLAAAPNLSEMRNLPGRCHELTADRAGAFAVDLHQPWRLLFRPSEEPAPTKPDGGIDWQAIETITILEVVDYH